MGIVLAALLVVGAKPAWDMVLGPQPHGATVAVYYEANVYDPTLPNVTREDAGERLPERFVALLDFVAETRMDSEKVHLATSEVDAIHRFFEPLGVHSGWMFRYEGIVMKYKFAVL